MMRRVIVVGASSHLGVATCRELELRGARVAGTYFQGEARLAAVSAARRLDLTDAAAITPVLGELAAELGGVDVLIHCAAVASAAGSGVRYDALADVDPASFARMLAINVTSALFCARAFATLEGATPRSLSDLREGVPRESRGLVLVGSIDGAKSVPTVVPYATSKGALVAMARALAKELAPKGILVNVVAPGVLDGGITDVVPEDVRREYLKHSALKRFGTHAEIARSIAWLALSNTYITGQTIVLDGGL